MKPLDANVLIVDDEPFIRDIIRRWLAKEGYRCVTASSGPEVLELLDKEHFDLLISDIRMPGMNGVELLSAVKSRHADVAVIMVTAVDDRNTANRTLDLGAYGYIIKPFDENEVLIQVSNALSRRSLTLASEAYEHMLENDVRERTEEIRRTQEEIVFRLVTASELRDDDTGSHIRRIGEYSAVLADKMGWDTYKVDEIRLAAAMHDVGKIGVPDSILLKPGKLTPDEWIVMKTHTTIGAQILEGSKIPILETAREIAMYHHERWDGSGYPHGLAGTAIPLSARIVAVADVYDALVCKRVYKPAMAEADAIAEMHKANGTHFDPAVFRYFEPVLDEFRAIRERYPSDH
ncbi:MAG: response regulator [Planctomycetota bacterium]